MSGETTALQVKCVEIRAVIWNFLIELRRGKKRSKQPTLKPFDLLQG
jgi:hypothetical protein